jgi:hypothetical protein
VVLPMVYAAFAKRNMTTPIYNTEKEAELAVQNNASK